MRQHTKSKGEAKAKAGWGGRSPLGALWEDSITEGLYWGTGAGLTLVDWVRGGGGRECRNGGG